jgi:hypothetical protein
MSRRRQEPKRSSQKNSGAQTTVTFYCSANNTLFGGLLTAYGGLGGTGSSTRQLSDGRGPSPAPDGGSGIISSGIREFELIVPGNPGLIGSVFGVGLTGFSGAGAPSLFGAGGKPMAEGSNGQAGQGYGSAGSGGCSNGSGRPGGAGAPGIIIVTEWA